MRSNPPHGSDPALQDAGLPLTALSLIACLFVVCALGPVAAQAQVQIDQVQQATGQVQGASQAEVIVATGDEVSSEGILNLVQEISPPPATNGNSAAVRQDGNRNDAAIRQAGTENRAVAEQIGTGNDVVITQDGGSLPPAFADDLPAAGEVFGTVRNLAAIRSGRNNLAVAVHEGSYNQTGIVQRGANNRAGIRLIGDDNTMNLVQAGDANQFLMDATVSEERMSVVQNGDGNMLDTTLPVNAKMNGNGIELVIRRGGGAPLPFGDGE
jgi:hypothetical protein